MLSSTFETGENGVEPYLKGDQLLDKLTTSNKTLSTIVGPDSLFDNCSVTFGIGKTVKLVVR